MNQHERYQQAKRITVLGAITNALLGFIKLLGGVMYHSHALVADGFHSLSDLLTDAMVIFASKYGSQDADATHPYGHQRIETAATFLLALILILAGIGISWDSLSDMLHHNQSQPRLLALPIALLSILANEGLFHYTHHIGKQIRSELIIANAWHHRSDAASSVVVLVGLIGSVLGFAYLDAVAAIIVGLMIVKMGWNYGWNSVKELVDTAVDLQTLAKIKNIIQHIDGVQKIHQLRSRSMGKDVFVDVHILVSPFISVSEGHFIAQHVHHQLVDNMEEIKDVTVHVDPEDDEMVCPSLHLPNRHTIEQQFLHAWRQDFPGIQSWVLHYLDGKLTIDLIMETTFTQWAELNKRLRHDLAKYAPIQCIRFFCEQNRLKITC
ncbi:cation diffusion facilitator family transporter [Legionella oakridgensis]|uniref:Cation diffusion facilitator family transporter n=2 Tax=Legionella oakridgensis TaxID=29423 RepID=W0BGP4_9GAMM|nr:cation diffusion facilitator family transporter [Legionella oakridgensis]AHE67871.1 cation diffusion facilitator family transporter [Legionella oakridgensis ATCC 33761 = DSM 21215]ETO92505.1 cation diffusion facilitator family transporter [Legionella oakridgensis RV-2-2007]KTD38694.1 cation efflux family protein [Legionella oakridgensis]STY20878.1 cation efflux family protein [Legionella longbeachae]